MNHATSLTLVVALVRAYDQSLSDCNTFAALWDNTCTSGVVTPSSILTDTDVTSLMCTGDATWCVGDTTSDATNTVCSHNYFTCVTCADDSGVIKIRVQSNNMPNVCWQTNTLNPNVAKYVTVDFKVTWNADMTDIINYDSTYFDSSSDTESTLCDL